MKGKFWRKALAAALALLIVSGSTPIQPLSRVLNDVTITANAVGSTLSGEGTVESPYVISDATDWATFAANVNAGTNSNAYYKLSDTWDNSENEVTATVGTESNPFTGTFDGNGKTLTVNINETSTQGTAPFREISGGAVIKNLTVKGSVAGTTHAAGLVGFSRGGSSESPNTIENCIVNVGVLNPATSGNRHIGGIVGHGVTSYLTIKDTVFGGIMANSGDYAGGLQGWSDGNHLTIDNCISKGSYSGSGSFHPIAIHNTGSTTTATVNGAYYTEVPTLTNAAQIAAAGTQVSASAPSDVMYGTVTAADNQTYYAPVTVSDINDYYLYTGNEIAIDCTVTAADGSTLTKGTHYTETLSPSTVKEKGEYTLTITGTNGYNGTQTFTFTVGDGIPVTAETTTMTTGTYMVTEDVTIGSRINISGDVKLILGEGTTLTANKGIELSSGNKLTIEGSGTLKATSSSTINKSGIGAQNFGTLIINGGNINATGWIGAAGIGTEAGGTNGGTIIINGGVVTAKGGHFSAGIGGCYNIDSGKSAPAGDITINGGQVNATGMQGSGQSSGIGIGNGYNRSANNGSLTLGWTSQTDFIYSENYNITNISFADGKTFFLDGTSTVATKENIGWKKIVPPTDEIAKNLEYAAISGIDQRYLYTGNTISLGYTLTAVGENLTNGTHFTETLTLGGKTVTEVKEKGTYTLTLTGTAPYTGTKSVTFTVLSEETFGGYAFTFSADDEGNYFAVDKKEALTALASYVNSGNNAAGLRFKQTADIDMQGVGYTPIGKNDTNTFGGIYDGDGYVIMNISHNTNGNIGTSGMFGKIKNGTVRNVNLKDCSFSGSDAGGIAGAMNQGTIDNCTVIGGKVSVGVNDYAGGIMGYFYAGTIKDCFTTTTVNPGGYSAYTGAVAGGSGGSITNCYYTNKPANNYYNHGVKVSGGFITADEGIAVGSGVFRTIGRTAENTHYFGKSGDTITLDSTLPPNTGYHMVYSKDGTALDGKTFTMPESDVNITASQTANFHIVVFDKNNADATGTMDNQSFTYDTAKSLTENNFKRTGYTFKGWNTKADGSGTAYADKAKVSNLTAENNGVVTLYAQWEINKYTVTWKNGDTVLETDENVEYGTTPTYDGETPTKDATAQYTYTFSGWSPAVDAVTGNTEYTAQFDSTVNEYTVTWIDGNGDTLKTEQVAYGETPVYIGDTPTKTSTAQYSYTFTGWDTTPSEVTGNVTYTAQFSETVNQYTVTWKNGDTILETDENVEYGTTPEYNGETPTKDATAQYTYTFSGWSPAVDAVTGNAEYTAVFDQTPKEYKVTYMLDGEAYGDVDTVAYGTELTVREAPTREGYTFSGWQTSYTTMPAQDIEISGTFTLNQYAVTYMVDGVQHGESLTVEHGTKLTAPEAPTKNGAIFLGWTADGVNAYDFEIPVTAETTLTAMWLDASGFITFSEGYAVTDNTYNGTDRDYVGFRFDVNMDNSNYTVVQHGILYGMNIATFGDGKADANLRFTDDSASALMDKVREFAAQNTDTETTDWIEVYIGDRPEGVVYARGFIIVTDGTNNYLIYSDVQEGNYNSFSE